MKVWQERERHAKKRQEEARRGKAKGKARLRNGIPQGAGVVM